MKFKQILPLEQNFTEVLKRLVLIPKMLYCYGDLPSERRKSVAIVGSRRNTQYGYEVAYQAAYAAAKAGAIVVSGLAYGVDSIAHRAALDAGGITIAVLGTLIDRIYPAAHKKLAYEIIESGGAVISEYGPEDLATSGKEMKARFLARNRIIAGLSDAVLVAEAADHSGTLNTAMHALDCGIDLLAAPGDITRLTSVGCNQLIKQGAIPYTKPDDLVDLLFPEQVAKRHSKKLLKKLLLKTETEAERAIFSLVFDGLQDGEEIIKALKLSPTEFSQTITILEIKGLVASLGMNKWMARG